MNFKVCGIFVSRLVHLGLGDLSGHFELDYRKIKDDGSAVTFTFLKERIDQQVAVQTNVVMSIGVIRQTLLEMECMTTPHMMLCGACDRPAGLCGERSCDPRDVRCTGDFDTLNPKLGMHLMHL
jgi:hypothetical protein